MEDATVVSFPLPMATAALCAVLAFLMWRLDLGVRWANALLCLFFGSGAVTSLMVGLRFGYGIEAVIPVQRTLPLFLGPTLYLAFKALAVDMNELRKLLLWHYGAPIALMALFLLFATDLRYVDLVISVSYGLYGMALWLLWRKGPDALINARVDVTRNVSDWMLRATGFLVFLLVLDTAIAVDFAVNEGANAAKLISYGSIPLVAALLAALIALPLIFSTSRTAASPTPTPETDDDEIVGKLRELMQAHQLYLDPDITVQRLAKRLSLPARTVSGAVNRTQGQNMSQYVNAFRLEHAARQLVQTSESATKIATQSGFTARSNFYREFQRVYGQSPVEYRAASASQSNVSASASSSRDT